MSEENKTVELKDEELENISGGDDDAYCMFRRQCNGGQNCKASILKGGSLCLPRNN